MNIKKIFEIMDQETNTAILHGFYNMIGDDYAETYGKTKLSKTTRKNAIKNYLSNDNIKSDCKYPGTFLDGYSIITLNDFKNFETIKPAKDAQTDICKIFVDFYNNKKPVDCNIFESIIYAKINGWRSGLQDYYITINNTSYNVNLIYNVYCALFENREDYCNAFISENKNALILSSKKGVGIILPMMDVVNDSKNYNYSDFRENMKKIDNKISKLYGIIA